MKPYGPFVELAELTSEILHRLMSDDAKLSSDIERFSKVRDWNFKFCGILHTDINARFSV